MGLVNFYRRFLPGVAVPLWPLTDVLQGKRPASNQLVWTPEMEASFMVAKATLGRATWLGHPDPNARLALCKDASSSPIGADLHQKLKGHSSWQPLGFFSHKLKAAQAKWSAFDRELFACVEGIRHFRFILEGQTFTIYTDHKPLVGALARVSNLWTASQCHHLAYMAKFTADIQHMAGQDNVAADALSRPPISSITAPSSLSDVVEDLRGIGAQQSSCPGMLQAGKSPSLWVQACEVEGVSLLCDGSIWRLRPFIPKADQLLVFKLIHGVAHPGVRATWRMITTHFVGPGMQADIASWCRDCVACQRAKMTKQS